MQDLSDLFEVTVANSIIVGLKGTSSHTEGYIWKELQGNEY